MSFNPLFFSTDPNAETLTQPDKTQLPPQAGTPSLKAADNVSLAFVHTLMSLYFATNKSLTNLPNTTLPQSLRCVLSSGK
jgi:hypothetical protein